MEKIAHSEGGCAVAVGVYRNGGGSGSQAILGWTRYDTGGGDRAAGGKTGIGNGDGIAVSASRGGEHYLGLGGEGSIGEVTRSILRLDGMSAPSAERRSKSGADSAGAGSRQGGGSGGQSRGIPEHINTETRRKTAASDGNLSAHGAVDRRDAYGALHGEGGGGRVTGGVLHPDGMSAHDTGRRSKGGADGAGAGGRHGDGNGGQSRGIPENTNTETRRKTAAGDGNRGAHGSVNGRDAYGRGQHRKGGGGRVAGGILHPDGMSAPDTDRRSKGGADGAAAGGRHGGGNGGQSGGIPENTNTEARRKPAAGDGNLGPQDAVDGRDAHGGGQHSDSGGGPVATLVGNFDRVRPGGNAGDGEGNRIVDKSPGQIGGRDDGDGGQTGSWKHAATCSRLKGNGQVLGGGEAAAIYNDVDAHGARCGGEIYGGDDAEGGGGAAPVIGSQDGMVATGDGGHEEGAVKTAGGSGVDGSRAGARQVHAIHRDVHVTGCSGKTGAGNGYRSSHAAGGGIVDDDSGEDIEWLRIGAQRRAGNIMSPPVGSRNGDGTAGGNSAAWISSDGCRAGDHGCRAAIPVERYGRRGSKAAAGYGDSASHIAVGNG